MSRTEDLAPGTRFGDLRIEREIGSGAFGRVWFARDTRLGREVALKVLQPRGVGTTQPEDRARFLEEARIMSRFAHPHIAILYHLHETDEGAYALEMEHLTGGTLDDRLGDDGRLPVDEALAVARDVASALAAAHGAGVIHGDVKPGNVLFSKDGPAKLVDFGLARLLNVQDLAASQKVIAGTPYYLAPEVIGGDAFKPASDVWSLGIVLYRMLAGRLPFPQTKLMTLFLAIQNEAPPPLGHEVPMDVVRFVDRCLSKQPGQRFTDGAAALAALERRAPTSRRRPEPSRPSAAPRVIGREGESARIAVAMDALADGVGGLLVVTGSAGIGKSTLVSAALQDARARGWTVVTADVSSVEGLTRPLLRAARSAAEPEGTGQERTSAATTATGVALEKALTTLASRGPVVVAIEDVHHASPEEVRLLGKTRLRLARAPVLWLASERTSEVGLAGSQHLRSEPLLGEEGAVRLDLEPLPAAAIAHLLETEVQDGRLSGAVLDRIVRRSGGNALFALQFLRHLRETAAIVREGDEWQFSPSGGASSAPPALHDIVAKRLKGLPEGMRALLDVAAVDGVEFDGVALAEVLQRPLLTVLRQLQTLYRTHGLVSPRERGYRFAHPLLQEVIYSEVAPELRREMHRALAEHLEARGAEVDPERLGVHWERSDAAARAVPHLLRAARAAALRMENLRAVDLAARAGVRPGSLDSEFARLHSEELLDLASCYGDLGRQDDFEKVHAALVRAAEERGDEELRLRAVVRRALMRYLGPGLAPGDEEEVRRATERLPSGFDLGRARYLLGLLEKYRGDLVTAERWLRASDELFLAVGEVGWHGSALDQLASLALRAGDPEKAEALYGEAAQACRRAGRNANAAVSEINRALAGVSRGALEGQDDRIQGAVATLAADGATNLAAHARVLLADVRWSLGDASGARIHLDSAILTLDRTGFQPGIVVARRLDGELRLAAGDLEGARLSLEDLRVRAERQQDRESVDLAIALDALRLLALGRVGEGEARALEALDRAAEGNEARAYVTVAAAFLEAIYLGLSVSTLEKVESLARRGNVAGTTSPFAAQVLTTARGAIAYARGDGDADLARASSLLRGERVGGRRSIWRLLGALFEAESRSRSGSDVTGAAFRVVSERASELEHVLLELVALRRSRVLDHSGASEARFRTRLDEVGSRLATDSDRHSFFGVWLARDDRR